jgi:ABC transporter
MHLKPVLMNPCPLRYDRVGQMSGGERRRLQLLQVLARAPNVLLLDEPSKSSLRSSLVFSYLVVSRSFYLPPLCSLSLYLFPSLCSPLVSLPFICISFLLSHILPSRTIRSALFSYPILVFKILSSSTQSHPTLSHLWLSKRSLLL